MKKAYAYAIGAVMISSSLIVSQGCTKTTGDDDELIGNWKRSDDFEGNARSEAVSFVIGENVYVGTGSTSTERFRDFWEYNLSRKYWTDVADMPDEAPTRNSGVAFAIGDKGYVGTGYDGANRLNDFWEFDPVANEWLRKKTFGGTPRFDAVAFSIGGKGYISCGNDGNHLKDLWEYTPGVNAADSGSWVKKASVGGSKRAAASAFVFGGKAYIISGNNNGEIQQDLQMYDPDLDTWTEKTKIYNYSEDSFDDDWGSIPRQNAVTFVIGNFVYLTCGENGGGSLNSSTWRYDPANDTWLEKTGFEGSGRTGAVAFALANRGFVLTGRSGSLIMDNMYELLPDDEQVDND